MNYACSLKSGEKGVVGHCRCKRLADLGFIPGQLVEMICSGNPCILKIGSTSFGVGQAHQCMIPILCKYSETKHE